MVLGSIGAGVAHADESGSLWERFRPVAAYIPSWVDNLPFKVKLDQSTRYNDNILFFPDGTQPPPALGIQRGDFYTLTTPGYSSTFYVGGWQLFSNGSYTFTRYLHDEALNTNNYSIDGGVDWIFTSACKGRVIASSRLQQAPFEEQLGFGINNVHTDSLNETARCRIVDRWSAILDSGAAETTNSLVTAVPNDNRSRRFRSGIEYEVPSLNTLRVDATFVNRDFFNRSAVLNPGLATTLDERRIEAFVSRDITPRFKIEGTYGQSQFIGSSPVFSVKTTNPIYSATAYWTPSPKLSFKLTTSQQYSSPLTIAANVQKTKVYAFTAHYEVSPKLSIDFTASHSTINYIGSPTGAFNSFLDQTVVGASVDANYRVSPLMNAVLSYRRTQRTTNDVPATSNLYLVGISYQR